MLNTYGRRLALIAVCLLASARVSAAEDVSFAALPVLQVSTPIPQSNRAPNDIDGDGVSDLLWFNVQTSQFAYWLMAPDSTGKFVRQGSRTIDVTPGYFIGATGDFNGDGLVDLVFTSAAHDLWLWTSNRTGGFASASLGTYPDGWKLVGAGDIDGDGQDDLLWTNESTCQFAYWLIRNGTRVGSKTVDVTCGYHPIALGYFSPTNRVSIVWDGPSHDVYIWDSKPSGFSSHLFFSYNADLQILALGGGRGGTGIGLVLQNTSVSWGSFGILSGTIGVNTLTRAFDASQDQSSVAYVGVLGGGASLPQGSAGYLVTGGASGAAHVVYLFGFNYDQRTVGVCSDPAADPAFLPSGAGDAPCSSIDYPLGWHIVGAEANGNAYAADPVP